MIFGRFRFDAAYSGGNIYAFGGEVRRHVVLSPAVTPSERDVAVSTSGFQRPVRVRWAHSSNACTRHIQCVPYTYMLVHR